MGSLANMQYSRTLSVFLLVGSLQAGVGAESSELPSPPRGPKVSPQVARQNFSSNLSAQIQ